jgi:hypothetical protein
VRRLGLVLSLVAAAGTGFGCASGAKDARRLYRASQSLSDAVKGQNPGRIYEQVVLGQRGRLDMPLLLDEAGGWSDSLAEPTSVRPEGIVFVTDDQVAHVVWTDAGWRFRTDPADLYPQSTPREALSSLIRASHAARWDVLLRLAPRRYRMGLSEGDLEEAWTRGEHAASLEEARERLAGALSGVIRQDSHQALLDYADGTFARMEREEGRWVVVDF